jgi:hypothetical protein
MANHNARICAPVLGIAEAPSAAPIGGSARDAHVPRLITERESWARAAAPWPPTGVDDVGRTALRLSQLLQHGIGNPRDQVG